MSEETEINNAAGTLASTASTTTSMSKKKAERLALKKLTCGNERCTCGDCGCPYGGCSCEPYEETEELVRGGPNVEQATIKTANTEDESNSKKEDVSTVTTANEDLGIGEVDLESKEIILNINIGILGHVNSGKTALVRALSRTLSTAALDKNPQSKERGMTLDLGFSSFATQAPPQFPGIDKLQYTLVDCPGHASLIRTIIGGAQIIDRMILVIDVTKGIQAQTAECLVIGEVLTDDMIVVLNKVDLIPVNERADTISKMEQSLRKSLANTKFADAPMVAIAAYVDGGGDDAPATVAPPSSSVEPPPLQTHNLIELVKLIRETTKPPVRDQVNMPLFFSVDHCFQIKGQGTILTGTIMSGKAKVGDEVEIPDLGLVRKIKSIQSFHRPVQSTQQGDRCSFAVSNLDSKKIERGIVCTPNTIPIASRLVCIIRKVKYFERTCASGSKIHVTIGPSTGLCKVTFFGSKQLKDFAKQHFGKKLPIDTRNVLLPNDTVSDWEFDSELKTGGKLVGGPVLQFGLLEFDHPIVCPNLVQILGSRLDLNESLSINTCRIAFSGRVTQVIPEGDNLDKYVRVYKNKEKIGIVDRVDLPKNAPLDYPVDQIIGRGLFKRDTDITPFLGLKVTIQTKAKPNDAKGTQQQQEEFVNEATGYIDSTFGKTGKFKVTFRNGNLTKARAGDRIVLMFKKYVVLGHQQSVGTASSSAKKEIIQ